MADPEEEASVLAELVLPVFADVDLEPLDPEPESLLDTAEEPVLELEPEPEPVSELPVFELPVLELPVFPEPELPVLDDG